MQQNEPKWIILWTEGDEEAMKYFDDTKQAEDFCLMKLGSKGLGIVNAWSGEIKYPKTALDIIEFLVLSMAPIRNPDELIDRLRNDTRKSVKTREPRL